MDKRKDALGAAAKLSLEIREIAKRHKGVCTVGSMITKPGIVTSVVAQADMTLDQRHIDANELAAMLKEAKEASERFAAEEKVTLEWSKLWEIHPITRFRVCRFASNNCSSSQASHWINLEDIEEDNLGGLPNLEEQPAPAVQPPAPTPLVITPPDETRIKVIQPPKPSVPATGEDLLPAIKRTSKNTLVYDHLALRAAIGGS